MMLEKTGLGIAQALDAAQPKDQQVGISGFRKQFEEQRPKLLELYYQAAIVNLLFTYRSLTDSDLGRYAAFAESSFGRDYHRVTMAALTAALEQAGDDLVKGLVRIMKQLDQKPRHS
jgi:hypothetical protein